MNVGHVFSSWKSYKLSGRKNYFLSCPNHNFNLMISGYCTFWCTSMRVWDSKAWLLFTISRLQVWLLAGQYSHVVQTSIKVYVINLWRQQDQVCNKWSKSCQYHACSLRSHLFTGHGRGLMRIIMQLNASCFHLMICSPAPAIIIWDLASFLLHGCKANRGLKMSRNLRVSPASSARTCAAF